MIGTHNKAPAFVSLLCVAITSGNIAQATQWAGITPKSVLLKGHIDETHVAVSVSARLAPQKDGERPSVIGELSVAYGPYRVTIPDRILWRAVDPRLDEIRMSFCCWGVSIEVVGDEIHGVEVSGDQHSTIGISVPYGIPYSEPRFENDYSDGKRVPQFPYIKILIQDGNVIGFEAWQFNGKAWIHDEYEWKDDRAILTYSFKDDE